MGSPVNSKQLFSQVQEFVEIHDQFNQAFDSLRSNAEISLQVGEQTGYLKRVDGTVRLYEGSATKADVEFSLSPAAVKAILASRPKTMGDLGVSVLKLVAAQEVKIKVVGRVMSVLTGGYLGIIKKAGPEFMGFLSKKGFKSLSKITQAIKGLK